MIIRNIAQNVQVMGSVKQVPRKPKLGIKYRPARIFMNNSIPLAITGMFFTPIDWRDILSTKRIPSRGKKGKWILRLRYVASITFWSFVPDISLIKNGPVR